MSMEREQSFRAFSECTLLPALHVMMSLEAPQITSVRIFNGGFTKEAWLIESLAIDDSVYL